MNESSLIVCVQRFLSLQRHRVQHFNNTRDEKKTSSLPKPLNTLLTSLTVSDLGVGLLTQPLYITRMVRNSANSTRTLLYIATLVFMYSLFFSVVAISADKILTVHLNLRYQELVTQKRVVAVVISIWFFNAVFTPIWLWASYDVAALVNITIQSFILLQQLFTAKFILLYNAKN